MRDIQKLLGGFLLRRKQSGFQHGADQCFEIFRTDFRIAVFVGDDLALLGQPKLAIDGPCGLREDGLIAGATTAAHSATAAMKKPQRDARQVIKKSGQGGGGLIELPVAGEKSAIFIAVGVAQHDVLLAPRSPHQVTDARKIIESLHDGCCKAQVFNRFKKRHND